MLEEKNENLEVQTTIIKCDCCGANLSFNPTIQKLYCQHCGNTQDIVSNPAKELDLLSAIAKVNDWKEDVNVFACTNCGAKVVLQLNQTAKVCPFCATSHVVKIEELAGLKPNALIPFNFDLKKAVEYSKGWARKLFFAPRKFKKNLCADNVYGLYSPCFTFDSSTFSRYTGRIGKRKTRVVGSGKNRRTQTYTVWRNISGTYSGMFDDVLITCGSKINQTHLDKISPFDTSSGVKYDQRYLLGYGAYHYDVELEDCWNTAKSKIDNSLKKQILSQYVYDVVDYLNVSTVHEGVTYKYVMLPVYVGNFRFKKKVYNFFVNGSSGNVWGKYPKSVLKIILTILATLLGVGIVAFMLYTAGFF